MPRIFSEVTRIDDHVGAKGGRYWWLMLACGHFMSKHKPRFDPARHILNSMRGLLAPHRVVCPVCKILREKETGAGESNPKKAA